MSRNCLIAFARHVKLIRAGNTKKQKRMPSLIKKNNNIFKVARVLQGGIHGIVGIGSYSLPEFTILRNFLGRAAYSRL
jgi:hypothetical protein